MKWLVIFETSETPSSGEWDGKTYQTCDLWHGKLIQL